MSRKFLTHVDLAKNELQNAVVQNLSSAPSSPVEGQIYYDTTAHAFYYRNNSAWVQLGSGTGDFSSNTATSVDSEIVLFSGTGGKTGKRATTTGLLKGTSGVLSAASAGTDYYAPGSTDVAVADGGTGSSTAAGAATNLGLGTGDSPQFTAVNVGAATDTTVARVSAGVISVEGVTVVTTSNTAAFTNKTFDAAGTGNSLSNIATSMFASNVVDTDGTLAANSDTRLASQKATKSYVDAMSQGLSVKAPVRVATTANGTLATAFENGDTIDGITLATGDRILLKDQTTAADRGIYIVAASGAPTRATDADASGEIKDGTYVWVQSGTVNADQGWVVTATASTPWVPGTDSSTWTQFSGASTTTAGAGLTATGNVFAVGAGTSITVAADSVSVDRTTNGSLVALCYVATVGDNSATSIAVTHSLGRQYVTAQVFDASSNVQVDCDVTLTSTTQTTFGFAVAPTTNQYRVVITG